MVTKQGYRFFTTNLKSGQFIEVRGAGAILENMVPYMDFYTPGFVLLSLQFVGGNMLQIR